ncbi:MAG: hypothetical protein D6702_01750 [Planctomycetota bacterium]|nr:MAG: hypothetical protein D6702_01750 [Planctomycetota bacterium]
MGAARAELELPHRPGDHELLTGQPILAPEKAVPNRVLEPAVLVPAGSDQSPDRGGLPPDP